jgi:hypothetical protein
MPKPIEGLLSLVTWVLGTFSITLWVHTVA